MERTAGFAWCPLPIWQAFHQQNGFGRFSHALISRIINYQFRETITTIMTDARAKQAIDCLFDSETQDGINLDDAVLAVLHLAAYPANFFIASIDYAAANKDFVKTAKLIKELRESMQSIDLPALQGKADKHTNFTNTGRYIDLQWLTKHIDASLDYFSEILNYPAPTKSSIQPRKANAERMHATLKAKLLKRDCQRYYKKLTFQVMADLITVSENLDEPYTSDDVRKA